MGDDVSGSVFVNGISDNGIMWSNEVFIAKCHRLTMIGREQVGTKHQVLFGVNADKVKQRRQNINFTAIGIKNLAVRHAGNVNHKRHALKLSIIVVAPRRTGFSKQRSKFQVARIGDSVMISVNDDDGIFVQA